MAGGGGGEIVFRGKKAWQKNSNRCTPPGAFSAVIGRHTFLQPITCKKKKKKEYKSSLYCEIHRYIVFFFSEEIIYLLIYMYKTVVAIFCLMLLSFYKATADYIEFIVDRHTQSDRN